MRPGGSVWVWLTLGVCAALVLGAMTWLTRNVVGSERERAVAEARADLQERMRLALWRMDSAGTALIVEEGQRPVVETSEITPPAPGSPVKMRFELSENGSLSAREGEARLPQLRRLLRDSREGREMFTTLCGSLEISSVNWSANLKEPDEPPVPQQVPQQQGLAQQKDSEQAYYNAKERASRGRAVDNQVAKVAQGNNSNTKDGGQSLPAPRIVSSGRVLVDAGPPRPTWIGGEMFLLRKIVWEGAPPRGGRSIQGVWLDTVKLRKSLLAEIRDLLPAAKLVPATEAASDGLVLASFPWRLEAGTVPHALALPRPIAISLLAGWVAALLAIGAASLLVRGILRLSERRASFVSAVTHELRTPLTTFRLYSDMLEAGAVKEEKRGDYLRVLSREADRLSHLVENVLAFSRIERGSARAAVRETTVHDLLEPMRERFVSRLSAAALRLQMDLDDANGTLPLRVDGAAVEHILFNLIDNAAKYAAGGEPPEVTITIVRERSAIRIEVRDHGPGVAAGERKRIFRAFHKSARDAAETRPGVGLGLALSRRLARRRSRL